MARRVFTAAALCVLTLYVGGCTTAPTTSPAASSAAAGVATCPLATLPPEAADTVRDIHTGGPFPFPRNDGVVFGNREGHLPRQVKGFYHEYTVVTPGAPNRSTRRIITGGLPLTSPPQYFYTADHYDSFCLVADAGGAR
ncbi:ribonuclease domain-containing protein [Mycolicibacterium sp. 050158]|uniref:ribonuclease domain-containing protein n=1 Tax=Mycolicibacterium sp. 050158 TaxID=3090602 RepID=UPI0039A47A6F